ncbi:hypothetical protein DFH06DRAFT_1150091 [Mycena polygramma]|nr:hypothetical protein DFH06DRAFT_1150091 [Mycena polygramma]
MATIKLMFLLELGSNQGIARPIALEHPSNQLVVHSRCSDGDPIRFGDASWKIVEVDIFFTLPCGDYRGTHVVSCKLLECNTVKRICKRMHTTQPRVEQDTCSTEGQAYIMQMRAAAAARRAVLKGRERNLAFEPTSARRRRRTISEPWVDRLSLEETRQWVRMRIVTSDEDIVVLLLDAKASKDPLPTNRAVWTRDCILTGELETAGGAEWAVIGGVHGGREGGREEGRKGGREEGRKGGREEGRKGMKRHAPRPGQHAARVRTRKGARIRRREEGGAGDERGSLREEPRVHRQGEDVKGQADEDEVKKERRDAPPESSPVYILAQNSPHPLHCSAGPVPRFLKAQKYRFTRRRC